ncbi:BREX-1 system adenine-specific DNA-methyltransferase PglX [Rectinema subterraneum]
MNLNNLKKFAQEMRRDFMAQVASRLEYVLSHDDEYLRAHAADKSAIIARKNRIGDDALIEEAAYLWFNRLAAFRYMDARGFTSPRIVSPRPGETQPELLSDIKAGRVLGSLAHLRDRFDGLLSGKIRASQPEREVYKEALLATCNAWADAMPWLFKKVDDWAGLLLPQDLLSPDSLVARMAAGLSDEDCAQGVEIIGWLYQFYISEKKEAVFTALKKNIKITKENIPAATQLFTPHWIVRFMVENSLGRLWLLNHPESRLKERMKYYVESDPEPDFLKVKDPAELKCLDPCCGSGHILAYFFELLYAMYEEEGYAPQEIPSLIVRNNIYGIDIDERAAELAAFTVAMVAREKDKRFFERGVVPNVTAMNDIEVDLRRLNVRLSPDLQESLTLLKEGRNYGSLISVPQGAAEEIAELERALAEHRLDGLFDTAERDDLAAAFRILEYLEPRYHVVVTNPPYLNSSNMNPSLKSFVSDKYKDYKADLFSVFIIRCLEFALPKANLGYMSPFVWMFISSHESLRKEIIKKHTITGLVQLEYSGFEGATVPICTFSLRKGYIADYKGGYVRLSNFRGSELQGPKTEEALANPHCGWFYRADQRDFETIPGCLIAYWLSKAIFAAFLNQKIFIKDICIINKSLNKTANNEKFLRYWTEVDRSKTGSRWVPYSKGGKFRKWFGNQEYVIRFDEEARNFYQKNQTSNLTDKKYWYIKGVGYTDITSFKFSLRYYQQGFIADMSGPIFYPQNSCLPILSVFNSSVSDVFFSILNPTLHVQLKDVENFPLPNLNLANSDIENRTNNCLSLSKSDWDLRETSWDFRRSPLLTDYNAPRIDTVIDENLTDWGWPSAFAPGAQISLHDQAESFKRHWTSLFLELHRNEEENNRIFIDLYGLQDELSPDVPYTEITILQDELVESARRENRIEFDESVLARQFVSYGVGCLMGRYSVEQDGLILADAGATIDDFRAKIPNDRFLPDPDGILPLTDEDDFPDDLPTAFKSWLRFISGEHYEDNLRWLEERLGKDLRSYFIRDFYKDHLKRYRNRPIYWMVSSPSGAFRALLYLHRYTKDSVGKLLNDYLRPYRTKLEQKLRSLAATIDSASSTQAEKTKARKRYAQLEKYLSDIDLWEKKFVYPLALQRIELDLDDGVKVNYRKLSSILEQVRQLEAKEEE